MSFSSFTKDDTHHKSATSLQVPSQEGELCHYRNNVDCSAGLVEEIGKG
jgi:hypothetical protein